ncbi:MAG: chlorophyll synthesis pathway protein BchC, partial [Pseudomonadota bacterium]
ERYHNIVDVSGDSAVIDQLVSHLAPQGEITLAGFYEERLDFAFPAAFMKEARIRIAAEWSPSDQAAICQMLDRDQLSLKDLITDEVAAVDANSAYETAFTDPNCLKMVLNWSDDA